MHASIRKYQVTDVAELADWVEREFVAIVREVPGFSSYCVVDGGGGTAVSVTLAESQDAVDTSAAKAAEWIGGNKEVAKLIKGPPEVSNGEVLVQS